MNGTKWHGMRGNPMAMLGQLNEIIMLLALIGIEARKN